MDQPTIEDSGNSAWLAAVEERHRQQLLGPVAPPECPAGYEVGPPTFVGVGVQKAGTTWWCRHLANHPGTVETVRKELHYFQHGWDAEFDDEAVVRYHRYFPRPPGWVTGEWTPRYMLDPWTPPRLRKAAPQAKLLVMLRDPVARLQSGLRHHLARSGSLHPRFILEGLERGRYATQLARLTRHFPRSQILVLQLETCSAAPRTELARTYEFVGLDPAFVPEDLDKPLYVGRGKPVVLPRDLRQFAYDLYAPELAALSTDWPEIDLDLWPTYCKLG